MQLILGSGYIDAHVSPLPSAHPSFRHVLFHSPPVSFSRFYLFGSWYRLAGPIESFHTRSTLSLHQSSCFSASHKKRTLVRLTASFLSTKNNSCSQVNSSIIHYFQLNSTFLPSKTYHHRQDACVSFSQAQALSQHLHRRSNFQPAHTLSQVTHDGSHAKNTCLSLSLLANCPQHSPQPTRLLNYATANLRVRQQ